MLGSLFSPGQSPKKQSEGVLEPIRMPEAFGKHLQVVQWYKAAGAWVKPGDVLAEVESDIACFELETVSSGYLLYQAPLGQPMEKGDLLAIIGPKDADINPLLQNEPERRAPFISGMVGEIRLVAFDEVPQNWLPCNGASVAVADYPELFSAIGSRFGMGIDSFALPALKAPDHRLQFIICTH
ncbi:tail fiber protein [Cesiribacter andamanensis]|uniref:Branched-chain alpha-keto acid dehydrogenase subunit E2 n=1 Tax=Cesiribacter andamanensis AMV16 TaxID=1279009 RepID=M7NJM0_9BACT|nr:tail fiber protein [Cesiribacter andamanensis]EMR01995.1 branched-chain alpha-keto acid dehydrogenase subunit E2 [Cesiribacter andamanensis AMV16]